jgi:hypothetical protein
MPGLPPVGCTQSHCGLAVQPHLTLWPLNSLPYLPYLPYLPFPCHYGTYASQPVSVLPLTAAAILLCQCSRH